MSVKLRLLVLAVTVLASLAIVPTASAAVAYRGVQLHSLWSSSSDESMARELDLVRDLGANAVRADIAWSSLQTDGPNGYSDWYVEKLDAFVAGAEARGMKVIANLWSTPCWASSALETLKQGCEGAWWDRGVTKYMPRNPLDYARTAQWLTARYGTKLAALEVWNEPNHENFLTAADPAAAYAPLVKATYPLAKEGNPDVPVLAGALSFADRAFLDRLYALGIKGSYDGISVHPYNEWRAPGDMWQDDWKKYTLIPGLRSIRAAQQTVGDNTPVWITEFGWTNCNGSDRWCVSAEQQASYLQDSFGLIDAEPYVKSAVVYNLRDKGTDRSYTEDNFGLMTRDYAPKPAYAAVRAAWSGVRRPGPPAPAPKPSKARPKPSKAVQPVKLYLTSAAESRRTLSVRGRVRGSSIGTINVTAFYAGKGQRFRRVARRKAPIRRGRFNARMAPFRHGRWKVQAVLVGARSAVDAQKFRLDGEGGARPSAPTASAEAPPGLVGEAQLGTSVTPGPLAGGGYIGKGFATSRASVREIQRALSAAGFETSVDGVFGSQTEAAVTRFQTANGLLVDGVVGRETMSALEENSGGS